MQSRSFELLLVDHMTSRSRATAISLYTGAGGLDYGLEAAGFETTVAVEVDRNCCETLLKNRRWPLIQRSIFAVATKEILQAAGLHRGEVDLVVGGPPCQPFSKSGFWARGDTGRLSDPRSDTLGAFMRVVEETLPHAILIENVEGLAYSAKDEGLELLLRRLASINRRTGSKYEPVFEVLNAADFGVPQPRCSIQTCRGPRRKDLHFPAPNTPLCRCVTRPTELQPTLLSLRPRMPSLSMSSPNPEKI